ncbi:DUF6417 family protein [Streptomyces albogriseolus]|uniref:DUF6417 family protein n=1 Tax=Streptomyces albogriseolus TaxID=1887 RepID=UPI0033A1604F
MDDREGDDLDESDLDEIPSPPVETAERLASLTRVEASDVFGLVILAQVGGPTSREADRLANVIAVHVPSENRQRPTEQPAGPSGWEAARAGDNSVMPSRLSWGRYRASVRSHRLGADVRSVSVGKGEAE